MLISKHIENKLALLPHEPGSYQMKDVNGKIIYVGKAKNLYNRVRSYFKLEHTGKTAELVKNIADFEFIVTNSDKEAFLLEITLIQKWQPYYNIRLKQGTGYPYIKITNENNPQLKLVSDLKKDGAFYFGPYPNVYAAQETLHFLQKVYPLRRCSGYQGRPCLYYHMGQCLGSCFKSVSKNTYDVQIKKIKSFLNGNTKLIKNNIVNKMETASENLEFEKAAEFRDQLEFIDTTVEKQKIITQDDTTRDVFNFYVKEDYISIQIFFIRQARLIKREKKIFTLVDNPIETMTSFILQYYGQKNIKLPKEILIPEQIDAKTVTDLLNIKVLVPKRGVKKDLLDLAFKNAKIALEEKLRLILLGEEKTTGAVEELTEILKIENVKRIEAFDHSHTQGTDIVSAMVVFTDGVADKKEYRKYKLKTINHADENQATREVIKRRYARLLKEHKSMPDLILIDGGEIQLHAAKDVLENELNLDIPVAAMVKNEHHETSYLIFDDVHLKLNNNTQSFKLVQRIQDEVHRFVIGFHKEVRSKHSLSSKLDDIAGVGPKTRQKLLITFGSLKKIGKASISELQELGISKKTANLIKVSVNAMLQANELKK